MNTWKVKNAQTNIYNLQFAYLQLELSDPEAPGLPLSQAASLGF